MTKKAVVAHAVVTGGSSGLGLALATRLASRGTDVTLVARDPGRLEAAAAVVQAANGGVRVRAVAADVSDPAAIEPAMEQIAAEGRGLDLLINSAGILREGYFEHLEHADFRDVMDINFFGTVNAVRAALPHLKQSRGAIVNIASLAGMAGVFGYTPYCAAKHALVGFTNSLRFELEPQGVRVQLVCPSEFDSPMVDALDATRTPENRQHVLTLPKLSVDVIADETMRGIDRGRDLTIPGRLPRIAATLQQHAPDALGAVAKHRISKVYQGPQDEEE